MNRFFSEFDWPLFMVLIFLSVLGLVTISSLAPNLLPQQIASFLVGVSLFFIFSQIDYRILEKLAPLFLFVSLFFLIVPLIFGESTRGALRWFSLGSIRIQPSEIVKPFLIVFFAFFFSSESKLTTKKFLLGELILALPVLLIFFEPDFGSSLIVLSSWAGIILAAGISWHLMLGGGLSLAGLSLVTWRFMKDYQRVRIISFLNPSSDPLGSSYNLIQAIIATGSGLFFGRGWGRGTQTQLKFLPERYTDFIFASLAEELGFIGSLILLLGFAFLLWRILTISHRTRDSFGALVCFGIFMSLFSQIFINIGMNTGLVPVTGITLPLISYGGNSLIATMISLGIVENISRLKKKEETIIIA